MTIAILSCGAIPLTAGAADDAARIRAIVDAAILPVMAEYGVPGMAVAVTVDGHAFFANYGVASKEQKTPVSEATLFELGSVSKTFTATLGSYAQVLGKLALDDHPGQYMPQLKGRPIDQASLLHLATYTAGGLPMQFPDEVLNDQMISYFSEWKPDARPGARRKYSNPSVGLFAHIAALALKRDFVDAMENQLFPQLGLKSTYIRVPQSAMANYAWGYDKANQAKRVNPDLFSDEAYGVKSTAADMIHFVQANIAPDQLDGPMRRAVDGTHVAYYQIDNMVQGLGWEQYAYPVTLEKLLEGNSYGGLLNGNAASQIASPRAPAGPTLFNKTGSTNGFGSYVAFVPEKKIGVVLLANKNVPIPARVKAAHGILGQLAVLGE